MKTIRHITTLVAIVSKIALCKVMAQDDIDLVEAIAQVESGGRDDSVGLLTARGERAVGRYQMLPSTWRDRTNWPVKYAHDHLKAQVVAVAHLRWLRRQLEQRPDVDQVTIYHLACAWRFGHAYAGKWDTNAQFLVRNDYAQRVRACYEIVHGPKYRPVID